MRKANILIEALISLFLGVLMAYLLNTLLVKEEIETELKSLWDISDTSCDPLCQLNEPLP